VIASQRVWQQVGHPIAHGALCRTDDRLREAIQPCNEDMDCFVAALLAMATAAAILSNI
jgi:hypothetical protein